MSNTRLGISYSDGATSGDQDPNLILNSEMWATGIHITQNDNFAIKTAQCSVMGRNHAPPPPQGMKSCPIHTFELQMDSVR
jgi:hypothetical protein